MAYLRPIITNYCYACGTKATEELVPRNHIPREFYCEDHAQYALEQLNTKERARFKGE